MVNDFSKLADSIMKTDEFIVSDSYTFCDSGNTVIVEVQNDARKFRWRMTVTGPKGSVHSKTSGNYQGIMTIAEYNLVTNYYEGVFPVFIPFKITPLNEVK